MTRFTVHLELRPRDVVLTMGWSTISAIEREWEVPHDPPPAVNFAGQGL